MINISAALSDPDLGFLSFTVRRMISTPLPELRRDCQRARGID